MLGGMKQQTEHRGRKPITADFASLVERAQRRRPNLVQRTVDGRLPRGPGCGWPFGRTRHSALISQRLSLRGAQLPAVGVSAADRGLPSQMLQMETRMRPRFAQSFSWGNATTAPISAHLQLCECDRLARRCIRQRTPKPRFRATRSSDENLLSRRRQQAPILSCLSKICGLWQPTGFSRLPWRPFFRWPATTPGRRATVGWPTPRGSATRRQSECCSISMSTSTHRGQTARLRFIGWSESTILRPRGV